MLVIVASDRRSICVGCDDGLRELMSFILYEKMRWRGRMCSTGHRRMMVEREEDLMRALGGSSKGMWLTYLLNWTRE